MGIEIDALFLANRSHTLDLATREVPPAKGGTAAKQYVFTLGDKTAALVVEAMSQAGRA
jgi:hypothetical protein